MSDIDALQNLIETKEILDSFGIEFWFDAGTLLGIYRNKKLIPDETKLDLLMWHPDSVTLKKLKKAFKVKGFSVYYDWQERGHCFAVTKRGYELAFGLLKDEDGYCFLEFYVPKGGFGELLNGALKEFGFRSNILTQYMVLALPTHYFRKLTDIDFMGKTFKAPQDTRGYLEFRYGKTWLIRKENYTWFKEDGAISNLKQRPYSSWKLVVGLSLFISFCYCFDMIVSYNYFVNVDRMHFIRWEQNRYVVSCFLTGEFPIRYFINIPLRVLPLIGVFLIFDVMMIQARLNTTLRKYDKYLNWSRRLFILHYVFLGITSITAGLTWYSKGNIMNYLSDGAQMDSYVFLVSCVGLLGFVLLKATSDWKSGEKNRLKILKIK